MECLIFFIVIKYKCQKGQHFVISNANLKKLHKKIIQDLLNPLTKNQIDRTIESRVIPKPGMHTYADRQIKQYLDWWFDHRMVGQFNGFISLSINKFKQNLKKIDDGTSFVVGVVITHETRYNFSESHIPWLQIYFIK